MVRGTRPLRENLTRRGAYSVVQETSYYILKRETENNGSHSPLDRLSQINYQYEITGARDRELLVIGLNVIKRHDQQQVQLFAI